MSTPDTHAPASPGAETPAIPQPPADTPQAYPASSPAAVSLKDGGDERLQRVLREAMARLSRHTRAVFDHGMNLPGAHRRRLETGTALETAINELARLATASRSRVSALEADAERLRGLAYMPGDYVCPTCGYVESRRVLHAHTGCVSAAPDPALPCPNDGMFMERMTWRAHAETACELFTAAAQDTERMRGALQHLADTYRGGVRVIAMDALASRSAQQEGRAGGSAGGDGA